MYQQYTFAEVTDKINNNILKPCVFQRPIDLVRVDVIKNYISEKCNTPSFALGMISINKQNGKEFIVDGQHRMHAIAAATDESKERLSDMVVMCCVYENLSSKYVKDLFANINQSKPMSDYFIAEKPIKNMATSIAKQLKDNYTHQFKLSENPRPPNLSEYIIYTNIVDRKIVDSMYGKGLITNGKGLVKKIKELNLQMGVVLNSENGLDFLNTMIKYKPARDQDYLDNLLELVEDNNNPCYLGIIPKCEWLECLIKPALLH